MYLIRLLCLVVMVALASPAWASITVNVQITSASNEAGNCLVTGDSCPAPLAVHFTAFGTSKTTCSTAECTGTFEGEEAYHKLWFKWDFGDPGSGTWSVSGQSKNVEYGPEAAHVYESSGTYTVTLQVCSDTECDSTWTDDIYVDDPDTVFASDTVCIYSGTLGDDCPDVTYTTQSSDFDAALATAQSTTCGASNSACCNNNGCNRILFKAGDTFTISTNGSILNNGPGIVGSYGTANNGRAIINATGCITCRMFQSSAALIKDWRFIDLEVTDAATSGTNFTDHQSGNSYEGVLYQNNKKMGGDGFVTILRPSTYPTWESPIGIFLFENEIAGDNYILYMAPRRSAYMGNTVGADIPIAAQHQFRFSRGRYQNVLVAHNEFTGLQCKDNTFRGCSRPSICPDDAGYSRYVVFRANLLQDTCTGAGCCGNYDALTIYDVY
jgi:hypothetical protein